MVNGCIEHSLRNEYAQICLDIPEWDIFLLMCIHVPGIQYARGLILNFFTIRKLL